MTNVVHWLNDTLKDIKHEKFKDVVNIEDAESEPTGDGQVVVISDIKRVTLTLVKPGGHKEKLKIIAKLEALTGPGRDFAALCDAFVTEITVSIYFDRTFFFIVIINFHDVIVDDTFSVTNANNVKS